MRIPHSKQTEQAVIGAVISGDIEAVADLVSPEDFFFDEHRRIYQEAISLFQQGKEVDPIAICEKLAGKNGFKPEQIALYMEQLLDGIHTTAGVGKLAKRVRELSKRRFLIQTSQQIANSCAQEEDYDALKKTLSDALTKILEDDESGSDILSASDISENVSSAVTRATLGEEEAVTTGYQFDEIIGGFYPGELYVLAGRPGMGKTALALNITYRCARKEIASLFFSLEMSATMLGMRLVAIHSGLDAKKIRRAKLNVEEEEKLTRALNEIEKLPIFVAESQSITPVEIRTRVSRMQRSSDIQLVIVDYLQLVRGSKEHYENKQQEVGDVAESLKRIAKELKIPIIALAQLNRKVEERTNKKPVLSDLRDSGQIEQAADVVAFLYREEVYDSHPGNRGDAEVIIAKNRNGDTGVSRLFFEKTSTVFEDRYF